ncbi:hypothetical protein O8B93_06725 [Agrobacterium rhizogenes]|uniref:hypothetical protein n=1 Tax=Rhizobium rhizogenes TaxID=359 RepID=UPI0022B69B92|nr:hypothetical protein [Rhizobium rhizogenes]MCZ7447279.1 hypothetical protein [Rhizobium rhizogenes]
MRTGLCLVAAVVLVGAHAEAGSTNKERVTPEPFGGCQFSKKTMSFAGDVQTQTRCLLRKVRVKGTGADPQQIPNWLVDHVDKPTDISEEKLRQYLAKNDLTAKQVGGEPQTPTASAVRYFVIHDTSSPEISTSSEFPKDMDSRDYTGNRLEGVWSNSEVRLKVNAITSRDGQSLMFRDWGLEREMSGTKLELRRDKPGQIQNIPEARPLFVHVENVQPRIKPKDSWAWKAPEQGLTDAQEKRLALLYVTASYKAGRWLVPAYHFNIDQGIPQGHDDPQNINLNNWVSQIEAIHRILRT